MKQVVTPKAEISYYYSGQHCTNAVAGDLILVQHQGFLPATIRFGQHLRYWFRRVVLRDTHFDKAYCSVNHAMIVIAGGPQAMVSQMEAKGGTAASLIDYVDKKYAVIHPVDATEEQRKSAVEFAEWCIGIAYGWFSIFGMALDSLIPVIQLSLGTGQRIVCSTASSLAHRCVGLIPDQIDSAVFPADLARYYDVKL